MSTTYFKMETHKDGSGNRVILTSFAGRFDSLEPDRSRVQLDIQGGPLVGLNRQQALLLAQHLIAPWTGEELINVD